MVMRTLCILGTRPEAIKMAPLIKQLDAHPLIDNQICVTGQHKDMLNPIFDLFKIVPHFNLQVMSINQDLSSLTAKILTGLSPILKQYKPNLVLVHGDTTTTLAASLSAYYHQVPIGHVEAGLRTGNLYSPWPEEANRKLSGALAALHFAPTQLSKQNLLREGVDLKKIYITGNTVIDALSDVVTQLESKPELSILMQSQFSFLTPVRKMVLITGHRRENFGHGFKRICNALIHIAKNFPEVDLVYPVHLNPNVQNPVKSLLGNIKNIYLIDPVDYLPFIYLMKSAYLILTDSGGIQEEAPFLGKPVLVMRDITERPEAVTAGTVRLVGTNTQKIIQEVSALLDDKDLYQKMSQAQNPYGDGKAAQRIVQIISQMVHQEHFLAQNLRYPIKEFTDKEEMICESTS